MPIPLRSKIIYAITDHVMAPSARNKPPMPNNAADAILALFREAMTSDEALAAAWEQLDDHKNEVEIITAALDAAMKEE